MVLHHIAHRAGFIIIFAAPAHAHGFRDSDLNMIYILRIPERLKQHISKADRHQILHGFFAQIMIDTIDLRFGEMF